MDKAMEMIRVFFVGLGFIVLVGMWCNEQEQNKQPPEIVYIQDPNYVQPPCEAQRRLKEQGLYRGRIDNFWGPETDRAFCDYCAIREIEALKESEKQ